jgi:AraC-like DNA-binding protein
VRLHGDSGSRLNALLDFAVAESSCARPGSRSVLLRIAELVFVEVLRSHLTTAAEGSGWLGGLRDPVVGRALAQLHAQPARPWTLPDLAHEAGASRSVLAERFSHFVGHPPMLYLTRWRMQLAAGRLAAGASPVSAVAAEVGYESEAAFCRAFKKVTGVTPASWRSRRRADA